jgi:hypothetical protein
MLHYSNQLESVIEFMNQVVAYVACVMLYLMTDYVESYEVSYFYGWGLMGLVAIFVGLNILIQLGVTARKAYSFLKRKWVQCTRKEKKTPPQKETIVTSEQKEEESDLEGSLRSVP